MVHRPVETVAEAEASDPSFFQAAAVEAQNSSRFISSEVSKL